MQGKRNQTHFISVQFEPPSTFPVSSLVPSDLCKGLVAGMDCNHVTWTQAGAAELTPYTLFLGNG